jgi:L-rhamnose mutarotase
VSHIGFKMKLNEGCADEYKRRHNALWPELHTLLKAATVSNYSIFLDEETNILFGTLDVTDQAALDDLPNDPIMQKWWDYMADIMATNADNSPVNIPLQSVFYML